MPQLRLLLFGVVALLARRRSGLPPFAMTLLTEALILGLFAMSLDLMVGYTRLVSFGHAAAYGLGAYASGYLLLNTACRCCSRCWPRFYRPHRDRRWLGVHAGDRRLVLHADAWPSRSCSTPSRSNGPG